ncbi:MAG: hypothetical protein ABIJ21_07175 [Nanoarchaeota archaeon]
MVFFRKNTDRLPEFLDPLQVKDVRRLLRQKKAGSFFAVTKTSFLERAAYPQLNSLRPDRNVLAYVEDINAIIRARAFESLYYSFSHQAYAVLSSALCAKVGFEDRALARAITCQIAGSFPVHILVLTDDHSLKHAIMESVKACSPVYEMTGPGKPLVAEKKGKELSFGIIPKSHDGILIIPDLGNEKKLTPIISAMDYGKVEYDGAMIPARASVLAFAEPRGLKLITRSLDILRRQLPCNAAVLSRFHLVFVVGKTPGVWERRRLSDDDMSFVRGFLSFVKRHKVSFSERYDPLVEKFMKLARSDENHFVIDITEKTAAGIKRLSGARAQLFLREQVLEEDVKDVLALVRDSLYKIG